MMITKNRFIVWCVILGLLLAGVTACTKTETLTDTDDQTTDTSPLIRVASLKGPTTMGMVELMSKAEADKTKLKYQFEMFGTADEIVPKIVNNDLDIALVPCNLASILYNKTEGKIQVAAINTLGVLYIVETGNTISEITDLKGKKVFSTGKGTTPEFAFNYTLTQNQIDPLKDLTVEYKSEATEIAVVLAEQSNAIALLPQPYVTIVQAQIPNIRVALSLTEEWNKISADSQLVTGVLVVRKEFLDENSDAFKSFLEEYQASTDFANTEVVKTAELVEKYGIVPKAAIAEKAIPACNITYIEGNSMKQAVSGYLKVLFEADPRSIGGKLPADDFYYQP